MEMSDMKNSESEQKSSNESKNMDVSSVKNEDDNSGNALDETFLKMDKVSDNSTNEFNVHNPY